MNPGHPVYDFEQTVKVGDAVEARFTHSSRALRFKGEIVKLNVRTARVRSLEDGVSGWKAGHIFVIQRFASRLWSINNGLFPPRAD